MVPVVHIDDQVRIGGEDGHHRGFDGGEDAHGAHEAPQKYGLVRCLVSKRETGRGEGSIAEVVTTYLAA